MRLEDVGNDDRRILSCRSGLVFPDDARRQSPQGPGLCVVVGDGGRIGMLPAEQLSILLCRIVLSGAEGKCVLRTNQLPPQGRLWFFTTATFLEAEALRDALAEEVRRGRLSAQGHPQLVFHSIVTSSP